MRTVPSSIGSGSESLLTCSKFHFEEKVLEKLVRLEHKVEIYEETVKRWENVFVSKLEKLDKVQKQSETFFKSMQAAQVQEEIRLNKSYSDIIDTFKSQMNNETKFYENLVNNLFESGSLKIQNKFQSFEEKTRFLTNNQNELNRKLCNNIRINVSNSFQNMESKQNATDVEVLNALSEIMTLDGKFAQESVKIKTLEGKFAQKSVQMKILEEESVKIKTLEDKFAEKSVNIRTLESKFAQESVKIKTLEDKFEEFGAKTKNLERQVADNNRKAPREGLYHFTAAIMSTSGGSLQLKIYHNKTPTAGRYITGGGYRSGTLDVVFNLPKETKNEKYFNEHEIVIVIKDNDTDTSGVIKTEIEEND
ncbi:unnamed protein product [Mytilus edulis]|uniref:Uncharacterized protein n=1 Tax=Mytilus edulis TaxID=6550 RepID=A0A8S3V561_MYTED|nr:unnamed protein product [Mytilus edulis]